MDRQGGANFVHDIWPIWHVLPVPAWSLAELDTGHFLATRLTQICYPTRPADGPDPCPTLISLVSQKRGVFFITSRGVNTPNFPTPRLLLLLNVVFTVLSNSPPLVTLGLPGPDLRLQLDWTPPAIKSIENTLSNWCLGGCIGWALDSWWKGRWFDSRPGHYQVN